MQNVSHPNIIKFYDRFNEYKKICVVMEYANKGHIII